MSELVCECGCPLSSHHDGSGECFLCGDCIMFRNAAAPANPNTHRPHTEEEMEQFRK